MYHHRSKDSSCRTWGGRLQSKQFFYLPGEQLNMSANTQEVLESAQALPAAAQVELIEALIAGLDEADPEPLDDAWNCGD
jgi:hypothetical protein